MSKAEFTFDIGERVKLAASEEQGNVVGRAEYQHAEDSYLVRYKAGDGRQVEQWWTEDALEAVENDTATDSDD